MEDFRIGLVAILKDKLVEGLEVVKGLSVVDKDYANSIVNMLNTENTIKDLESKIAFDKEMQVESEEK